jgi:hypothetical protein
MQLESIPLGLCQCGCGQRTNLPRTSWAKFGWVAGIPLRYIHGHNPRQKMDRYTIDLETGCHVWYGAMTGSGYGSIRRGSKMLMAHRWFYEQAKGPIPAGMFLDHLCRRPLCVNPDHLEPVSHTENLRRGNSAKLTRAQAREIRDSRGTARAVDLAEKYGVTPGQINNIMYGFSWRDLS